MDLKTFHLPTKPYDIIAAVNRAAAATGYVGYALRASSASYNGHGLTLAWNDYRAYWVGGYTWSGWQVIVRSESFADALQACKEFYAKDGLGASLAVYVTRGEDEAIIRADADFIEGKEEAAQMPWITWKFGRTHASLRDNTFDLLIAAESEEAYEEASRERRFPRRPVKVG
jgi:hypothetical protein